MLTKSSDCLARLWPVVSALARASSWFTMCVARTLDLPMCLSDFFSSSALVSRCARSACMRRPASGVFSWCAASAKNRFWVVSDTFRRLNRSLIDDTSGATSSGTAVSSSGLMSSGLRARMRFSSCASGLIPRTSASHTSSTASGRVTNCGTIVPLTISVASVLRFSSVSATCTNTLTLDLPSLFRSSLIHV